MSDEPKQHPAAPPAERRPDGPGYQPPPPDPQGDLEAVAALMGMTQATSKDLSENVVGAASNSGLKKEFDAHRALKTHMTESGTVPQVSASPPPHPVQPIQPVQPAQVQQQYQQAAQVYAQQLPVPQMDDGQILRRLLAIEDKLDGLMALEEKIVKQLSRKSAKQITIRFNDSENKKPE